MNAVSSLERMHAILTKCTNRDLPKFTSDQEYSTLFNRVTKEEQEELRTLRQRAEEATLRVQDLTQAGGPVTNEMLDIRAQALRSLGAIRDMYLLSTLFPEHNDQKWRKKALQSIPPAIRRDVLVIAITFILPSDPSLKTEVLRTFGEKLLTLSTLSDSIRGDIYITANSLIRAEAALAHIHYCDLILEVAKFHDNPELIDSIRRLTRRCEDSEFLLRIVTKVRDLPDDRREAIVRATSGMIVRESYSSGAIYALLLEQIRSYRPEQRPANVTRMDAIEFLATLLAAVHMFHEPDDDPYLLEIGRADFISNPFQTLQTLTELFAKGKKESLKIKFIGEKGVGDGPTREFVSELVNGVCDKLEAESGLGQSLFRPYGHLHREVYVNLGKLFMFILNAKGDLLTGRRLHPSVWVALTELSNNMRHLEVFEAMYSTTEKDLSILAGVQKSLDSSDEDLQIMAQEMIESALCPLIAIREGMESAPFEEVSIADVLLMTPEELAKALEGTLDVEEVISKLNVTAFSEQQKEVVQNWIRGFDEAKMMQFLYAMTGVPALGKKELRIGFLDKKIQSATCHNLLFVPEWCKNCDEDLIGALEAAIVGKKEYTKK